MITERRLYLDAAGSVVEADDPTRAELLAAAGTEISDARARALGLVEPEPEATTESEPEAAPRRRGRK